MGEEEIPDIRPYLCIPYWSAPIGMGSAWDTGLDRPLPGAVVSYLCESIHAGPYTPGEMLDVTVDVRNSGGGNGASIATVVVYWAVPTVGFAKPTFFAAAVVDVPPSRSAPAVSQTPTMSAVIPASAPDHICLVVSVSHPQDRAGKSCDPVNDRHWAQRNLTSVAVAAGAPAVFPFLAANPFDEEMEFDLIARPVDERRAWQVASVFQTEVSGIQPRVRLLDEQGAAMSDGGETAQAAIGLGPLEERRIRVLIELDADLPAGQSVPIEVSLLRRRDEAPLVGSLGIVILPPGTG